MKSIPTSEQALMIRTDFSDPTAWEAIVAAAQIASIDNNLSIANMGFEEFAGMVDETGVFRGIPGM